MTPLPTPPGTVDVHTHAIAPGLPDLSRYAGRWPSVERTSATEARILLDGAPYRVVDDRCWSAERRLADMDAEQVAVQLVSPIPVTLCHGESADGAAVLATAQNEFLAGLAAAGRGRLRPLGAVPLQDPARAAEELVRCVRELGFAGVEIGTRVGERELADPAFDDFFAVAAEIGAVVLVHPVDQTIDPRVAGLALGFGLGMPAETGIAAAALVTGRERTPGVRLCLAHAGGTLPAILPRLDRGAVLAGDPSRPATVRARELWSDSLAYDEHSLRLAVTRFGAGHVVLGTDYPFAAREAPAGAVLAGLDDDLRRAIGRDNGLDLIAGAPATDETGGGRWERSSASA
ncbi:amidohydrolase family protein [Pseudonocardia sp. WMMC193]|uniref:amidohydrolase family protein n=1 Tax=Pseudonocardia sp. WMMC193 TaxID=2911965 RepID=UPI001F352207|nr:amidohydrolase family protein [Pseudonocardia sp. WMMC193]MCF7550888.1 amidohydrolase [Pseudonocardia sp. WMMC193]